MLHIPGFQNPSLQWFPTMCVRSLCNCLPFSKECQTRCFLFAVHAGRLGKKASVCGEVDWRERGVSRRGTGCLWSGVRGQCQPDGLVEPGSRIPGVSGSLGVRAAFPHPCEMGDGWE